MKVEYLDDSNYIVVEVPSSILKYFNDVEEVVNQDEKSKLHSLGFFYGSHQL